MKCKEILCQDPVYLFLVENQKKLEVVFNQFFLSICAEYIEVKTKQKQL